MAQGLFFTQNSRSPRFPLITGRNGGILFQYLPRGVLAFEGKIVRDHRDKFAIRRFSLDARDGVAEESLQGLHIAAVPGHLDGMADFRDLRPES